MRMPSQELLGIILLIIRLNLSLEKLKEKLASYQNEIEW